MLLTYIYLDIVPDVPDTSGESKNNIGPPSGGPKKEPPKTLGTRVSCETGTGLGGQRERHKEIKKLKVCSYLTITDTVTVTVTVLFLVDQTFSSCVACMELT